jgi:hypothetical protein
MDQRHHVETSKLKTRFEVEEVLDNSNNTPDKIIIAFGRVAKGKFIVIHFCVSLPVD